MTRRVRAALRATGLTAAFACVAAIPATASAQTTPAAPPAGSHVHAASLVPGLGAVAPVDAPAAVQEMIVAANRIARKPYIWGGGHVSWRSRGYDCSGSVSYILHAAGLLDRPLVSGQLARWGARGRGRWVTIYANPTHVWIVIAGLRFDNGHPVPRGQTHWHLTRRSTSGFVARHIAGL